MVEGFRAILQSLRIQDFFDILIISILVYGILIWFRKTASRFVLVGIALLGIVYFLARQFQLYLTAVVLQGFFAILLVALVVIFQEELRRFFEHIATWRQIRTGKVGPAHGPEMEVITQSVATLAQKHVGALIVFQGEEPLDRHLEGGTELEGLLSVPLLESVFDPHSGGHDGAVVIREGRLVRFGCHLPLSLDSRKIAHMGLRHTAALGLAERSDALCIVVSEERGEVSAAREGQVVTLRSASELKQALDDFYRQTEPWKGSRGLSRRVRKRFWEKCAAVLLSCTLWLAFGYPRGSVSRNFVVPIEYRNLPSEWVMEEPRVNVAEVLLRGPEQAFRLLDPNNLAISLDLSSVQEGEQDIVLTRDMVQMPSNLSLEAIKPKTLQIRANRLLRKHVPVEVVTKGALPAGWKLDAIEVKPASVTVLIPPLSSKKEMKIQTQDIDLGSITGTATLTPQLILPPDVRFVGGTVPSVTVTIEVHSTSRKAGPENETGPEKSP
jgi:diadenylate cyclase